MDFKNGRLPWVVLSWGHGGVSLGSIFKFNARTPNVIVLFGALKCFGILSVFMVVFRRTSGKYSATIRGLYNFKRGSSRYQAVLWFKVRFSAFKIYVKRIVLNNINAWKTNTVRLHLLEISRSKVNRQYKTKIDLKTLIAEFKIGRERDWVGKKGKVVQLYLLYLLPWYYLDSVSYERKSKTL